ncbi:hypothetical protein CMQ_1771 [Grosmannia clavigera kw1407]|uniref:Nucleotide-diphospho-sugar transferase n=1 Tax=Grosmannia clavigera (strain kw1407 / UAMH 11150) TaxID=655863 RepID=F0XAX5_GROCL|nr:uncharacterized protein CMQ_1771 [Grosmannia clavigera kw1407]EFX05135.1 hypothetical protein CMQ_1771 [Grosmannia clavigera kw1407]
MWNRRYIVLAVVLCTVGIVLLQPRSQGFEYTKGLLSQYGRKRTSQFHLLVPASGPNLQLCRALVSSALLGYPPAVLSGWNGTGELDAAVTHLAKVRNVVRYFDSLPPTADDDLFLIIDGYDVIMQLPPDVLIRRYFAVTAAANVKLAARFGDEPAADDVNYPHQSILFGADKLCWPVDFRRPACYAVPETGLPDDAFGLGDDITNSQPRWLNSGTIIGPVSTMRAMFAATIERIAATYDPEYICRESDQMYMSDVWGEQEYARSVRELRLNAIGDIDEQDLVPVGIDGFIPEGADPERWGPLMLPGQKTEFQIGLDYESSLFQAWAGYEDFLAMLSLNSTDDTAIVDHNVSGVPDFALLEVQLPDDLASLTRLVSSISDVHNAEPKDLISTFFFGTNLVTNHVYCMFHCTGEKGYLEELWVQLWFYPYAKALLKATVSSVKAGMSISDTAIDGRIWKGANTYPCSPADEIDDRKAEDSDTGNDEADANEVVYGAWADLANEWLSWEDLCAEHEDVLFGIENSA